MSSANYEEALQAAKEFSELDSESLFRELGLRIEDVQQPGGEERKEKYLADFVDTSPVAGWDFLQEVGRRWYDNVEAELMKVLCDKENADRDKLTGGKSIPQIAASLVAAGLFTVVAAPPAWAIIAATLVAQKVFKSGLDALCGVYYERKKGG